MTGQIDCKFFTEHLDSYLDSELDQATRQEMHRHAANCPSCGECLESMTRLLTMCAEMDEGLSVPLEAQAAWRKAVRAEAASKERKASSRGAVFRRWTGGIAAALVLLVGGTFAYRMGDGAAPITLPREPSYVDSTMPNYYAGTRMATAGSGQAIPAQMRMETDGAVTSGQDAVNDAVFIDEAAVSQEQTAAVEEVQGEQVVLRTAERTLESSSFDQSLSYIQNLVTEYQGYFEQSTVDGQSFEEGGQGRAAELSIRVSSESLDDFLTSLDAVCTVTYKSESAQDISDRYYDVETRLESYRVQMERLNQLLGSASLEDMLLLEDKRTEVQQEIDSLEGQLKSWSSQAQLSTVYVTLREVKVRDQVRSTGDSLGERVKTAFYDSVNWLNGFLQDAAVVLAIAAPVLVVLIPILVVVWAIVAGVRHRKGRKRK
ncbi:MAG TPA: DUF4349 domain-containing protein [Candidatus Excrementavichristensenella intestinipullorum]|nr:DUF4349 domain-containing protein [Candidatus Excrementavichristensenella intestinipullorum]